MNEKIAHILKDEVDCGISVAKANPNIGFHLQQYVQILFDNFHNDEKIVDPNDYIGQCLGETPNICDREQTVAYAFICGMLKRMKEFDLVGHIGIIYVYELKNELGKVMYLV